MTTVAGDWATELVRGITGLRPSRRDPRVYRGCNNQDARKRPLSRRVMKLVPVTKKDVTKPGRKTRRIRRFKWVPA